MVKPYANQPNNKPIFNEGQTPVGTIVHLYHDKPQLKTSDQYGKVPDIDKDTGVQKAEWKITLAWHKSREQELMEIHNMKVRTQEEGWPGSTAPGAHFYLEDFFRDGDNPRHNTENKEYLKGKYYLNFKKKATIEPRDRNFPVGPQNFVYGAPPGLLGPYGPEDKIMNGDVWPGCTGRCSFTMFASEYMGKHYISVRLQNIQKYDEGDGTRIGGAGGPPPPEKQFGALMQGSAPGQTIEGQYRQVGQQQPNPFGAPPAQLGFGGQQQPNPFGAPVQPNPFGSPAQNPFGSPSPQQSGFGAPPSRIL